MRNAAAFLLVWAPYIASTYLAEVAGDGGPASQSLMLLSFVMIWPAAILLGGRHPFGLQPLSRSFLLFGGCLLLGLLLTIPRWLLGSSVGALKIVRVEDPISVFGLPLVLLSTFVPAFAEDVITRGFPLFAWPVRRMAVALVVPLSAAITSSTTCGVSIGVGRSKRGWARWGLPMPPRRGGRVHSGQR